MRVRVVTPCPKASTRASCASAIGRSARVDSDTVRRGPRMVSAKAAAVGDASVFCDEAAVAFTAR